MAFDDTLIQRLKDNDPTLTELYLKEDITSDAGTKNLADALEKNQTLTTLWLMNNNISPAGAKDLADALEKNQTLTTLFLANSNISDDGAKYLAATLKKNKTLTSLAFKKNQIGDTDVKYLADALEKNQTLTRLTVTENEIGDASAKYLAETLEKNQTLTALTLTRNQISGAGVKDLATALEKNQTLTELALSGNNISDAGVKCLAETLEKNHPLTELFLAQNNISDAGAKDLATALENNQTLIKLDLEQNNIGPEGAKDLAKALQNNFALFEIKGVDLPESANALLERNKTLKLVETRQAAITALNALRETLSILREEIEKQRKELNLSPAEAHTVIQFGEYIRRLSNAIQELETAQAKMAPETSEGAQKVKKELQQLHDECVTNEMKLLTTLEEAVKSNLNVAIGMVEQIPETSPLFHLARFLIFRAAYDNYQSVDNYPPTQALVEALPLLKKEDGRLLTDFITASKDIEGMLFKPAEQQRVFDSAVLAAAGHDVMPAKEIALTNDVRADLLRFALLRYAKDIATDVKQSKLAGTLFAGTKKEIPPRLTKSLTSLSSSFDVTKSEERENVRKLFDEAYGDLGNLLSKKPKETQAINDLKTCRELMAPLSTKPIAPEVSSKPAKEVSRKPPG